MYRIRGSYVSALVRKSSGCLLNISGIVGFLVSANYGFNSVCKAMKNLIFLFANFKRSKQKLV